LNDCLKKVNSWHFLALDIE